MIGVLIVTIIALILSIFLVLINYYLNKVDKKVEEVLALLPGYNCGACGFGGCPEMAQQIVHNKIEPKMCKPIKPEQLKEITKYLNSNDIKGN